MANVNTDADTVNLLCQLLVIKNTHTTFHNSLSTQYYENPEQVSYYGEVKQPLSVYIMGKIMIVATYCCDTQ